LTITVAIATKLRPKGLQMLLQALQDIQAPIADVNIAVIDNDPCKSAHEVVEQIAATSKWPIKYIHESREGIPFARNAAIDAAADSEFLAFIDDDETPKSDWLVHFEHLMQKYPAVDAVTGPVDCVLPKETPEWVRSAPMFKPPKTGPLERRNTAATSNVFIRVASIQRLGLRFDERFPLMGGSDTEFFSNLTAQGGQILFDPGARVFEHVPVERTSLRWILRRGYRGGYNPAVRQIADRAIRGRVFGLIQVVLRVCRGFLFAIKSLWQGSEAGLLAGIQFTAAIGTAAAIFGIRFEEYKTVDGE